MLVHGYKPEAAPRSALAICPQCILRIQHPLLLRANAMRCAMGLECLVEVGETGDVGLICCA